MNDKPNAIRMLTKQIGSSSMAEMTANHLMEAIIDGKINQDDVFPSQQQLSESFGVSRTVIREATQILVSKGILDVKHGKRIAIRPPSHEQISESVSLAFRRNGVSIFDVLELRKVLEAEAASLAAKRAEEADLLRMNECLKVMDEHYNEEQGYVDADVGFHNAIFAAAKQPAFELVLLSLMDYLTESRKLSYRGEETTRRALRSHQVIFDCIRQRDPAAARLAMLKHLADTEEDLRGS